jgi:hypothetical protein
MCEYTDEELMVIIRESVAEHGLAALKTIEAEEPEPMPAGLAPTLPRLVYPAR